MTRAEIACSQQRTDERDAPASSRRVPGTGGTGKVALPGVDLLRTIGVVTVIYSHISYYFVDGMGTSWWLVDVVYRIFVRGLQLNQHLTFLGVVLFMMLTGALITGSTLRHSPGVFLFNRIGRLVPLLWVSIAVAVLLVRLHINGMFSGGPGISNGQAAWSFILGGFFHKPEFAVLGVTWTLVVQVVFYIYCVSARSLLRRQPGLVPVVGSAVCAGMVCYDHWLPGATLPIVAKVVATLPTIFLGQVLYFAWNRRVSRLWVAAGIAAPLMVVWEAEFLHEFWGGVNHYLWTVVVGGICVLLLARRGGRLARARFVRWMGTRSYPIYLVHTLILYKVYQLASPTLGRTGGIVAFLLVTALVAELAYRWIEVPAGKWISARLPGERQARGGSVARPRGPSERANRAWRRVLQQLGIGDSPGGSVGRE